MTRLLLDFSYWEIDFLLRFFKYFSAAENVLLRSDLYRPKLLPTRFKNISVLNKIGEKDPSERFFMENVLELII